jgi:hypothetical protein
MCMIVVPLTGISATTTVAPVELPELPAVAVPLAALIKVTVGLGLVGLTRTVIGTLSGR